MSGILLVAEQREGKLNKLSWETMVVAQQVGAALGIPVSAALLGHGIHALADELSQKKVGEVWCVEHELLRDYTPDGYTAALEQIIRSAAPEFVFLPHTYQVRDFAPKLAARLDRGLVSDCIAYRIENGALVLVRQMFQGRTNTDVIFAGSPPYFATFQAGAFRADQVEPGTAPVKNVSVAIEPAAVRNRPLELFREAKQAVDLSQAEVIVAIGRGIKAPENMEMVKKLAELLGGEIGASRPICDEGWLPMERQIGSSGQTVAPKLYIALGISGAIQHVVGMKGSRTVVAVNKDSNAPIFDVADYGIVGDLFEVVPALIAEVEKAKA